MYTDTFSLWTEGGWHGKETVCGNPTKRGLLWLFEQSP
jgi:hypothetical protein